METLLNNPLIQSSLLPLSISFIVTAMIGFSSEFGKKIAGIAIGVGLLLTVFQIQGFSFMPRSASQKLPYLIIFAGLAGLLLDALNAQEKVLRIITTVIPVSVLAWLFGARFGSIDVIGWVYFAAIISVAILARQQCVKTGKDIDGPLKLLFVSIGLGVITVIGSSALLGQTAFALSAAIGGFLLLNWPTRRFRFGAAAQLVVITSVVALLAQTLFFTKASGIALLLLLPLLFIDQIQTRINFLNQFNGPVTRALSLAAIAFVLLPLAIGSAVMLAEPSGMAY